MYNCSHPHLSYYEPYSTLLVSFLRSTPLHGATFCQLNRAMPKFSKFYSTTEAEAATTVRKLFLQKPAGVVPFDGKDAEQLASLLGGSTTFTLRSRNHINQPIFHPEPSARSDEHLLEQSTFSVTEEAVVRDKGAYYESTSEESWAWRARSRTPSSDDRSPHKTHILPLASSIKIDTSSVNNGEDYGLANM